MPLPEIGGYSLSIQQNGANVFKTQRIVSFIPAKTFPIKIFTFSSGNFAVVFKAQTSAGYSAVRCFLQTDDNVADRYSTLGDYVNSLFNIDWLVRFQCFDKEFLVETQYYPVVLMDWIDGIPINKYVTQHIINKNIITDLQAKLLEMCDAMFSCKIAHGDLQAGNILITNSDQKLKLIDYDGMYVPELSGKLATETGRPEYQHPNRTSHDYNEKMDWFSFWVFLTALEAIKIEPSLWNSVYDRGFNTSENFLFTGDDFRMPQNSNLFKRLLNLNDDSLNFYVKKLLSFCSKKVSETEKPYLYNQPPKVSNTSGTDLNKSSLNSEAFSEVFSIKSNVPAIVLSQLFQKLGSTPCELERKKYTGKKVIISYANKTKVIELTTGKKEYYVEFI